jgi:hypothetical protein
MTAAKRRFMVLTPLFDQAESGSANSMSLPTPSLGVAFFGHRVPGHGFFAVRPS